MALGALNSIIDVLSIAARLAKRMSTYNE